MLTPTEARDELMAYYASGRMYNSAHKTFYRKHGYVAPGLEDCLADVLLRVLGKIESGAVEFGSATHIGTYTSAAVINAYWDMLAKTKNEQLSYDSATTGEGSAFKDLLVAEESEEEEVELAPEARVAQVLSLLDGQHLELMKLRLADVPFKEIAVRMGITLQQAKNIWVEAKRTVCEAYGVDPREAKKVDRKRARQFVSGINYWYYLSDEAENELFQRDI